MAYKKRYFKIDDVGDKDAIPNKVWQDELKKDIVEKFGSIENFLDWLDKRPIYQKDVDKLLKEIEEHGS